MPTTLYWPYQNNITPEQVKLQASFGNPKQATSIWLEKRWFIPIWEFLQWYERAKADFGNDLKAEDFAEMAKKQGFEVEHYNDWLRAKAKSFYEQKKRNSLLQKVKNFGWGLLWEVPDAITNTAEAVMKGWQAIWKGFDTLDRKIFGMDSDSSVLSDEVIKNSDKLWSQLEGWIRKKFDADPESGYTKAGEVVTDIASTFIGWPKIPKWVDKIDDALAIIANSWDDIVAKLGLSKSLWQKLVAKIGEYMSKNPVKASIAKWALQWARDTAIYDAVANSEIASPGETALGALAGGTISGILGKWAQKTLSTTPLKSKAEIAGKIVQGETDNAQKAVKALQMIDRKGINTYDDLSKALNQRKTAVAEGVDAVLDMSDEIITPSNSITKTTVGSTTVESNYVQKAFDHLDELFIKLGDDIEYARIQEIYKKYLNEWLTLKEVNNLARDYSRNLSAFSTKTWDPLTSVWAKALENTRKWLKSLVRERLGSMSEEAVKLDDAYHNLADTSMLVDQMVEKVNKLWQKVEKRTWLQALGNKAGHALDFAAGGLPKEIVSSFFLKSNQWLKVMNSIDLEKNLPKYLKQLNELEKLVDNRESRSLVIGKIRDVFWDAVKYWAINEITD